MDSATLFSETARALSSAHLRESDGLFCPYMRFSFHSSGEKGVNMNNGNEDEYLCEVKDRNEIGGYNTERVPRFLDTSHSARMLPLRASSA